HDRCDGPAVAVRPVRRGSGLRIRPAGDGGAGPAVRADLLPHGLLDRALTGSWTAYATEWRGRGIGAGHSVPDQRGAGTTLAFVTPGTASATTCAMCRSCGSSNWSITIASPSRTETVNRPASPSIAR